MRLVLFAFSMIWIAFGSFAILYTTQYRDMMKNILTKIHLKIIACFPFIGGILLFICSSASHYPWLIKLIGILAIAKGAFLFINPVGKANGLSDWYLNSVSDQTYRFFGIIAILFGSAVYSWII
ncbi:hypothetical protein ACFL2E_07820 [Thermodesulfobacteriota bacterium]|jgi:uncharacterized protein YjeT (DUF2065 family)